MPDPMMVKAGGTEVPLVIETPRSPRAALLMAPGAGGDIDDEFMRTIAQGVIENGIAVGRFNFAYKARGRKAPDRPSVLEETFTEVAAAFATRLPGVPLFLGGKSMGGRIASQIVARGQPCAGLVFFGYPLHPPGRPERLRDEHLGDIRCPMLFIEGTRDPFCPLDTLERVVSQRSLGSRTEIAVIDDGDHSFRVRKSSGRSTADALQEIVGRASDWIVSRT